MKKALSISELLIAMAIIGTVATLVLPGFIRDYHKKIYVTKLKKIYETIELAVNQSCVDNNVSFFNQTPYSKYVEGGTNQQLFVDKYFKRSSFNTEPFSTKYRSIQSSTTETIDLSNTGSAKLVTGEDIAFSCLEDKNCFFRVDINSSDGPNVGGRDLFVIGINPRKNLLKENYKVVSCISSTTGNGCLGRIIDDNWEMKY